jgi:hypothetical protein
MLHHLLCYTSNVSTAFKACELGYGVKAGCRTAATAAFCWAILPGSCPVIF